MKVQEDQYPKTEKNGFMRSILPDQNINNLLPLYIRSEKKEQQTFFKKLSLSRTSVTSQANGNNSKQPFFHPVQKFIITHLQVQNEGQTAKSPTANTVKNSR